MPARLVTCSLGTDLRAAGGELLGALLGWTELITDQRDDGDDRVNGTIPGSAAFASQIATGYVLRYDRLDSTVEEYIIETIDEAWPADVVKVMALPASAWLEERVLLLDATANPPTASFSITDTPANILAAWQTRCPDWPTWLSVGTIEPTAPVTVAVSTESLRSGIRKLVAAINAAQLYPEEADAVFRFRRVSESSYAIDLLQTPATSTASVTEGKNLNALARKRDRANQISGYAPVGASGTLIQNAYFRVRSSTLVGSVYVSEVEALDGAATIVLQDDQWNDYYIVDSASTPRLILDTAVGSPRGTLTTSAALATGLARLARNSSGDTLFEVVGAARPPRLAFLSDDRYNGKQNWIFNPQFEVLSGGAIDGWVPQDGTVSIAQSATHVETGSYAGYQAASDPGYSREVRGGTGGTIPGALRAGTWEFGLRYYSSSSIAIRAIIEDGIGNTLKDLQQTGTGWQDKNGTFTLSGTTAFAPVIKLITNWNGSTPGVDVWWDRLWLYRVGIDDGDNTLVTSNPLNLMTLAQRYINLSGGGAVETWSAGVDDNYRDDPDTYPNDRFSPFTTIRFDVPSRGVDTMIRLVGVTTNELAPKKSTVTLGTLRPRLRDR